jgi:hypothetical protein
MSYARLAVDEIRPFAASDRSGAGSRHPCQGGRCGHKGHRIHFGTPSLPLQSRRMTERAGIDQTGPVAGFGSENVLKDVGSALVQSIDLPPQGVGSACRSESRTSGAGLPHDAFHHTGTFSIGGDGFYLPSARSQARRSFRFLKAQYRHSRTTPRSLMQKSHPADPSFVAAGPFSHVTERLHARCRRDRGAFAPL